MKKERKGEPEAASKHKKVNCDLRKEMKAAKNFIGDQCRTTDERITKKVTKLLLKTLTKTGHHKMSIIEDSDGHLAESTAVLID